ncbi:MAG: 2-oxo acid dehydrogenase subunit E2 [Lachnospiraceae bacterium]|nr:2-oxo acid dehydrogenase subunit E2 [Lachnospiraceae bacterium]
MQELFAGRKKRWGDRKDGSKVRNLDPMTRMTGYIMKDKVDAWVLFEEDLDITQTQEFVREHKEEIPGLSLYHVLFASLVRTISQTPQINRFCYHNNVYARNEIKIAMTVKKGLKQDSDRTLITPKFSPDDTLADVTKRINDEIKKIDRTVQKVEEDNNKTSFDRLELALSLIPDFVLRFVIWLLKALDRRGYLPRKLTDLSPFHSSLFITNMGSFGMDSVYHHIYEFGTVSGFGGMGMKKIRYEENRNGEKIRKVYIPFKFVIDERICDGYTYGVAFKQIKSYMARPETLLAPPEQVIPDIIDRKLK